MTATGIVIAIDGPAGVGKSTAARSLAESLGFFLLDTGALYRCIALFLLENGVDPDAPRLPREPGLGADIRFAPDGPAMRVYLGVDEVTDRIREERVGIAASKFSALPAVRSALLTLQRSAVKRGNLVAEGRDMGTVVFPNAAVKFFLAAALEERALRRLRELARRGLPADYAQVLRDMSARDERDITRPESPLVKAADAFEIDTTALSPREVLDTMRRLVRETADRKGFMPS